MKYNRRKYGQDITVETLQMTTCIDMADEKENDYSIQLGYGPISTSQRYKRQRDRHAKGNTEELNKQRIAKLKEYYKVNKSTNYGTGMKYIELTTGFIGTRTDMIKRFGNGKGFSLSTYVKYNKPCSKRAAEHLQGLDFRIYEE